MLYKIKYILLAGLLLFSFSVLPVNAAQHALGSNIITPEGTVYTITTENGRTVRRPYTSAGAFLTYSFNSWSTTVVSSPEDLALPIGSFIPPQDGKIICSDRGSDKGTCYLITNAQKAGFTSANVFKGLGYDFSHAMSGDVSFLPSTSNIDTTTEPHNPGALINKEGTIYLVSSNGLLGLPAWSVLQSWGYVSSDIVPANLADKNLTQTGVIATKQPGELSPNQASSGLSFGGSNPNQNMNTSPTPVPASITTSTPIALPVPSPAPATPSPSPSPNPSQSPAITNISPNGNSFPFGSNIQISWTASNLPSDAKTYLKLLTSDGGVVLGYIVNSNDDCYPVTKSISGNTFQWNVNTFNGSSSYLICTGYTGSGAPQNYKFISQFGVGSFLIDVEAYSGTSLVAKSISSQPFTITNSGPSNTPATVSANPSFSVPSYAPGTIQAKVASFIVNNPAGQDIKFLGVTLSAPPAPGMSPIPNALTLGNVVIKTNESNINGQISYTIVSTGSSNNIIIPANGNLILNVYADIPAGTSPGNYVSPISVTSLFAVFTATGTLGGGLDSNGTSVAGSNLIVTGGSGTPPIINPPTPQGPLVASLNSALGSVSSTASSTNVKIGSYIISNPKSEDVSLFSLSFDIAGGSANPPVALQNVKFMVGSSIIDSVAPDYISGRPISYAGYNAAAYNHPVIPAGGSLTVDVYADVISGTAINSSTALTDCVGTGKISAQTFVCSGVTVNGQSLIVTH